MDMIAAVNKFLDEYEAELQKTNKNTFPLFHKYNGFGYVVITLEEAVSVRNQNFKNDIKNQLEELDNTPLTRKQYEEKKEELMNRENVYASMTLCPSENPSSNQYFYREITRHYMQAVLTEAGLTTEQIDEEFRRIWEGMDFYAMFMFFETSAYKYAEDNGRPMSENYIYDYEDISKYKYQENMLNRLMSMIKDKYSSKKK